MVEYVSSIKPEEDLAFEEEEYLEEEFVEFEEEGLDELEEIVIINGKEV